MCVCVCVCVCLGSLVRRVVALSCGSVYESLVSVFSSNANL